MTTTKLFFVAAALGWAACATSGSDHAEGVPDTIGDHPGLTGQRLRLVAGNISSGNQQAYEQPGIRIFQGLKPDVAMIQEMNVGADSASEIRTFIDSAFGTEYSFVRGAASEQIPNGVVSRYPILNGGEWTDTQVSNRQFTWAQIDIPGPVDLYAISVHLLTANASVRNTEAGLLKQNILSLPQGAYVVLGGDFNTGSRSEAALTTLSSVLVTSGPFPVDRNGQGNTNANRNKPYDWVLVSGGLQALETPVVLGSSTFDHGLVADTRVYSPISDIAPALASDSAATNMQHMAIVRDFALPTAPQTSLTITAPISGDAWTGGGSETIAWTASGVSNVKVELATDGTTFTTLSASTPASAGELTVTAPLLATTAARVRVSAVPGGAPSATSDAFEITHETTPPPPTGGVFINEVLANEPGSDTAGEFVEIVNGSTAAVSLGGWTISDATAVRHTFAAGTTLAAGKAIVVFAGASAVPAGLGNAIASSTGSFVLGNSGDTVKLASPSGLVDSVTYTSALSGADGVSMNRSPDGSATGTWVLHTALTASPRSPGVRASGASF